MDSPGASLNLLAHFDSPEPDENALPRLAPSLGVTCVLKWTAAAAVLFVAVCVLLKLGYCIAAEQALTRAARAAAFEATLPRATRQSIAATVARRLASDSIATNGLQIYIRHSNAPIGRAVRLAEDDQVSVTVSVPANAVLPAWLNAIPFHGGVSIQAHAKRRVPSRYLPRHT
jgi:hypothetical protein